MDILTKTTLDKLDFFIPKYKKYVNDYFLAVPKEKIKIVIDSFNQYHNRIKFACQLDDEHNTVHFLDTRIIGNVNSNVLKIDSYTKETYTGRYLNYKKIDKITKSFHR